MKEISRMETVSQYNAWIGQETLHPLVTVVDFSKMKPIQTFRRLMGVYAIFMKDIKCGNMTYGCNNYDYEAGTLIFVSPGQIYGVDSKGEHIQPHGFAILFHPDFIHGTSLGKRIKDYSFFSYEVNEALHLSERERTIVNDCFNKVQYELDHSIDKHSRNLIVSNIELFLDYCVRFYDRQFITRSSVNSDILNRFEKILDEYFKSDKLQEIGHPTVRFCADQLHLSSNYLGDLIRKETGKTAQEHIQLKLMNAAKQMILDPGKTLSEVAYELGFKYPQHFTRMFKKSTGCTPNEYRSLN